MNLYALMSESPYLTFFFSIFALCGVVSLLKFIVNRPLRHMNIRKHGWPPEHCDADGDFREPDDE